MRRSTWVLAWALFAAACTRGQPATEVPPPMTDQPPSLDQPTVTNPPPTIPVTFSTDRVVLQLHTSTGRDWFGERAQQIPELTLWGNGRVVFRKDDGSLREATIPESTVKDLVSGATSLFRMMDRYDSGGPEHLPHRFFTVEANKRRKTVRVHHIDDDNPGPNEHGDPEYADLRGLLRNIRAALPTAASAMTPETVTVAVLPAESGAIPDMDWPPALIGDLSGQQAREALERGGLGRLRTVRMGGKVHNVIVKPLLPLLHLPPSDGPAGGFPRHPAVTVYGDQVMSSRFEGVSQGEVFDWYKYELNLRGWKTVKEQPPNLLALVHGKYGPNVLVVLRFRPDHLIKEKIQVEGTVPRHPLTSSDSCTPGCQIIMGVSVPEAEAWFREYMAYLGWKEESPNHYRQPQGSVRLNFQIRTGGVLVTPEYP